MQITIEALKQERERLLEREAAAHENWQQLVGARLHMESMIEHFSKPEEEPKPAE